MEFERIYLILFVILVLAFVGLCCIYALYLVQRKVTSVAVSSADVAFFPMRLTALAVRSFFRTITICFDVSLFGLKVFLVGFKFVLTGFETCLLVWRAPVLMMISIVQRIRGLRKRRKSRPSPPSSPTKESFPQAKRNPDKVNMGVQYDLPEANSDSPNNVDNKALEDMSNGVFWGAVGTIRNLRNRLRPDLTALPGARLLIETKAYLRRRAGLEKEIT